MSAQPAVHHDAQVICQPGPAGDSCWATCTCDWTWPVKGTTTNQQARQAVEDHLAAPAPPRTTTTVVPVTPPRTTAPVVPWSDEQKRLLKDHVAKDCNDAELAYFGQVCQHRDLDPFLGEIVAIKRGGRLNIQETVEGLRTIAERSGLYGGQEGPWWCGPDERWHDVWLSDQPPAAARVLAYRQGWAKPSTGTATWASNVQFDNNGKIVPIWKNRPDEMLAKCAEVRALKKAFTKEFARAGVNVRDLTDEQIVAVEARLAGIDDTGRRELVTEVTDGRTDSSRELTDAEKLTARARIAQQRTSPGSGSSPPLRHDDRDVQTTQTSAGSEEQQATLPADDPTPGQCAECHAPAGKTHATSCSKRADT
jgi:phage recombination protein Bet